jgi:hypothetical protein
MADQLPLLVFPSARAVPPPKGRGFPPSKPHFPQHGKQIERLAGQILELQQSFDNE